MVSKAQKVVGSNRSAGISCTIMESGVALIRLAPPSERIVTLTEERLESLREILELLKDEDAIGIVFMPTRPDMFSVGVDLNVLAAIETPLQATNLIERGQAIISAIEALSIPTIAAISGPCVGGACELALACRYRIMSTDPSSHIGLPEVKSGIIPGFGGTQRLPRLIGLRRSLELILNGRLLTSTQALRIGLVDAIFSYEELEHQAIALVNPRRSPSRRRMSLLDAFCSFTSLGRRLITNPVRRHLKLYPKNRYPALHSALEVMLTGLIQGRSQGLLAEVSTLSKLLPHPETKNLINLFFLHRNSKQIGRSAQSYARSVLSLIIGTGSGHIAALLARGTSGVILQASNRLYLQEALGSVEQQLCQLPNLNTAERSFVLNRIEAVTKPSPNCTRAGFGLEAVPDTLEDKEQALRQLAQQTSPNTILATTTSLNSVTRLASAISNPGRVLGFHMPSLGDPSLLVELVRGRHTSDRSIAIAAALALQMNKYPIVVRDVHGFLVNRLRWSLINEADFILQEGWHPLDIDNVMEEFGWSIGLCQLQDRLGLSFVTALSQLMENAYGERMKGPQFAYQLVQKNRLGRDGGAGFYLYQDGKRLNDPTTTEILGLPRTTKDLPSKNLVHDRLLLALINEAVRCLEEGVAGAVSREAAGQIDLASVLGLGFPPQQGGILRYANSLGVPTILKKLQELEKQCGPRFTPAEGLHRRQITDKSLYEL